MMNSDPGCALGRRDDGATVATNGVITEVKMPLAPA
jgi:hypothetical protein